jgi:hypothetical protein
MAASIETRASWTVAFAALAILSVVRGAPLAVVVALRPPIARIFASVEAGPVSSVLPLAAVRLTPTTQPSAGDDLIGRDVSMADEAVRGRIGLG